MTRTTLILDENRLIEMKRLAASRRQTLSALVDEFLAAGLKNAGAAGRRRRHRLRSFSMGKPRVNVADRDQIQEFLRNG